jgi:hypothetical protein
MTACALNPVIPDLEVREREGGTPTGTEKKEPQHMIPDEEPLNMMPEGGAAAAGDGGDPAAVGDGGDAAAMGDGGDASDGAEASAQCEYTESILPAAIAPDEEALVIPFDVYCETEDCSKTESEHRQGWECTSLGAGDGGADGGPVGDACVQQSGDCEVRRTGCGRVSYREGAGRWQSDYDATTGQLVGEAYWSDVGNEDILETDCNWVAYQTGQVEACPDATVDICTKD